MTTYVRDRLVLSRQLPRRPPHRRRRGDSLATEARRCGRRCSRRPASPSLALSSKPPECRKGTLTEVPPGVVSSHKGKSVPPHTPKTRSPSTTRTRAVLKNLTFSVRARCLFSEPLKSAHQSAGGVGGRAGGSPPLRRNWPPPTYTDCSRAWWRWPWRRSSLIPPASSRPPPPRAYRGRHSKKFQPLPRAPLPKAAVTTER